MSKETSRPSRGARDRTPRNVGVVLPQRVDRPASASGNDNRFVCRHWLQNKCKFPDTACKFQHQYDADKIPRCVFDDKGTIDISTRLNSINVHLFHFNPQAVKMQSVHSNTRIVSLLFRIIVWVKV